MPELGTHLGHAACSLSTASWLLISQPALASMFAAYFGPDSPTTKQIPLVVGLQFMEVSRQHRNRNLPYQLRICSSSARSTAAQSRALSHCSSDLGYVGFLSPFCYPRHCWTRATRSPVEYGAQPRALFLRLSSLYPCSSNGH